MKLKLLFSFSVKGFLFLLVVSFLAAADDNIALTENEGNPVSLEFRDTDIREVLRVLADMTEVNIVSADNVKGKVTVTLKEVTLNDALDAILSINGCEWKKRGNIIFVEGQKEYVTEFIQLKYADASEIKELLSPIKSENGSILIDPRSNKLILRDYEGHIKEIKKILNELDIPAAQVTINAKIIDINISDAIDLGLNLGYARYNGNPEEGSRKTINQGFTLHEAEEGEDRALGRNTDYTTEKGRSRDYGINLRQNDGDGTFSYEYDNVNSDNFVITDVSSVGTFTTSVVNAAISNMINVQLDALVSKGKSLLLASPTITTLNNETASIIIGDKVGIKEQTQTTTGTTETIRFQDVGTKLEVTPQINIDGYITMKIKPEISSVIEYTQDTVQFRTREAQTKVRVRDGQTVIIGGLIKNEEEISRRRVPFLSRIPILGIPFRSKFDSGEQTELVVFLTPKILKVDEIDKYSGKEGDKRNLEAEAKEEELIKKFSYGYQWNQKPSHEIGEDKSRAKKLFKEAERLARKSKRMDKERGEKIRQVALNKFQELIETYPESEHIPQALYAMALLEHQSGNNIQARNLYERILSEYPDQSVYRKAEKKLKKITDY